MLVKRYVYLTEVNRIRFDDVIRRLSEQEFFVSENTVIKILRKNNDFLNQEIAKIKKRQ
ncbi:MAG: hypothetical protein SNJ71_00065 [Bacteroidales bacterium]